MPSFPRKELEEMVDQWINANKEAEQLGDWTILSKFYTADAEYRWNMGHNQEFYVRGRQDISDIAMRYHMKGFEKWRYPYHSVIMDEKRGTVICFYDQVAPATRSDGSPYQVDGVSGSWFEYAGNFQWRWQCDFFDLGNVKAVLFEMAGAGALESDLKRKIHQQAMGQLLPGTRTIRSPGPSLCTKVQNVLAMIRIVVFGR